MLLFLASQRLNLHFRVLLVAGGSFSRFEKLKSQTFQCMHTKYEVAAPARPIATSQHFSWKSPLFSASVVHKMHLGSSSKGKERARVFKQPFVSLVVIVFLFSGTVFKERTPKLILGSPKKTHPNLPFA